MKFFTQILTLLFCTISIDSIPGVKDIVLHVCNEIPSVVIDSMVRTPSGSIYVFFGPIFSVIESITPNGLPVIHKDFPQITQTFWGQMVNDIRVAFAYNQNIYFYSPVNFWKHNPFSNSTNNLDKIDEKKEFLFFQNITDIINTLISVSTEPNLSNELKTIFLVNYWVLGPEKYIIRDITEGNTTIDSRNTSKVNFDSDFSSLESLVIDYWQRGKQTILTSLRTINKMYYNYLHIQGIDRALRFQNKFRPNVRLRTVGYNQVFFGCPQPMCLDSTLDTIMNKDNDLNTLMVFRGRFWWTVRSDSPPLSSKANLISQAFKGLPNYLDASYYVSGQKIFFKNDLYYTIINGLWIGKSIFEKFPGIETPIDAIFHIKKTNETFIFKDNQYWIFIDTELKSNGRISDFEELPNYIDAALSTDHKVIIFKNWYYYEIDIKDYIGELYKKPVSKPNQTFTTFFNCPQNIYSSYEGNKDLNSYLNKYEFETKPIPAKNDRRIGNKRPIIKTTTDKNSRSGNQSKESVNWLLYLILGLILFFILIIIILFVVNDSHKERYSKKPKVLVKHRYKAEFKVKNDNKQSVKPVDKQTNINLQKVSKPKTPDESLIYVNREDSGEGLEPIDRTESSERPLQRVSTEFFIPSPNPTLEPEHKVKLNDIFMDINDNKSQ